MNWDFDVDCDADAERDLRLAVSREEIVLAGFTFRLATTFLHLAF